MFLLFFFVVVVVRKCFFFCSAEWDLCEFVIVHMILGGSSVILWISLGGKPKWLLLKFGYHDVMRTSGIVMMSTPRSHSTSTLLVLPSRQHRYTQVWSSRRRFYPVFHAFQPFDRETPSWRNTRHTLECSAQQYSVIKLITYFQTRLRVHLQCIQDFFPNFVRFKKIDFWSDWAQIFRKDSLCHPLAPNFFFGGVISKRTAEFRFLVRFHGNVPCTTRFSQTLFYCNTLVSHPIFLKISRKTPDAILPQFSFRVVIFCL